MHLQRFPHQPWYSRCLVTVLRVALGRKSRVRRQVECGRACTHLTRLRLLPRKKAHLTRATGVPRGLDAHRKAKPMAKGLSTHSTQLSCLMSSWKTPSSLPPRLILLPEPLAVSLSTMVFRTWVIHQRSFPLVSPLLQFLPSLRSKGR